MKVHANAPLGAKGREAMVLRVIEQGWSLAKAAAGAGVLAAIAPARRAARLDVLTALAYE